MKVERIPNIHPGMILKEDFMELHGLSINKLSRLLFVPPIRISQIVNGKRSITADTALRLEKLFGARAQFWLNLQDQYDLEQAKEKCGGEIADHIRAIHAA